MKNMILNSIRKAVYCTLLGFISHTAPAQCPPGYSKFTLKWDYLDYMVASGNYAFSTGYYTSLPYIQNQYFSFGSQRLNIACNYSKNNMIGENITHKGEAGSYGNGKPGPILSVTDPNIDADVQFLGNGQVVLTFDTEVYNLQFSLFDIDNKQIVDLTAADASGTALPIAITPLGIPGTPGIGTAGVSQLIITGNNTTAVNITSPLLGGTTPQYANTSAVNASVNVDIAGPVKKVTFTASNSGNDVSDNGSYWLSDITACTPGAFPTNYYNVSKPFAGQPSYVLHSLGNSVYKLDPATGKIKFLFTDPTATTINSMAYDPYNKFLYYVNDDGLPASTGRSLKKYDFNADAIFTVSSDLVTLGIALSTYEGVNNGGAAFYNGSLFLGVQTTNSTSNSGREALIWRIDFDAANNPVHVSQAFGLPCDDGAGLVNGFGDFVIRDGVIYESDNGADDPNYYTVDMKTGLGTTYAVFPASYDQVPGEMAMDWTGKIYQVLADNGHSVSPYVAPYNEDGTIGTETPIVSNPMYSPAIPLLADAADAFRPKSDFGDAPASYDPATSDPATHEKDDNLHLGANYGYEWTKTPIVNGDTYEDGIGAAPALNYFGTTTYSVTVNVFNNTGADATLVCWLDWNFNGVYDPGEGQSVTVPTSASMQLVPVNWPSMWVGYTSNTNTWLRLRLTSAANGMTTSNMNGYYPDGEVEDFPVTFGAMLAANKLSFTAALNNQKMVNLEWKVSTSSELLLSEVERSADGKQWHRINALNAYDKSGTNYYNTIDHTPLNGNSYYRIKLTFKNEVVQYTDVKNVYIKDGANTLNISLNPAQQYTILNLNSSVSSAAMIDLNDNTGRLVMRKNITLEEGDNLLRIDGLDRYSPGIYYITVRSAMLNTIEKLVISR